MRPILRPWWRPSFHVHDLHACTFRADCLVHPYGHGACNIPTCLCQGKWTSGRISLHAMREGRGDYLLRLNWAFKYCCPCLSCFWRDRLQAPYPRQWWIAVWRHNSCPVLLWPCSSCTGWLCQRRIELSQTCWCLWSICFVDVWRPLGSRNTRSWRVVQRWPWATFGRQIWNYPCGARRFCCASLESL